MTSFDRVVTSRPRNHHRWQTSQWRNPDGTARQALTLAEIARHQHMRAAYRASHPERSHGAAPRLAIWLLAFVSAVVASGTIAWLQFA